MHVVSQILLILTHIQGSSERIRMIKVHYTILTFPNKNCTINTRNGGNLIYYFHHYYLLSLLFMHY